MINLYTDVLGPGQTPEYPLDLLLHDGKVVLKNKVLVLRNDWEEEEHYDYIHVPMYEKEFLPNLEKVHAWSLIKGYENVDVYVVIEPVSCMMGSFAVKGTRIKGEV